MKTSIDTRELITIIVGGIRIQGTFHKPPDARKASRLHMAEQSSIAVLFLNPGIYPRSAVGDLAVHLADSVAASGYPAFRLDLPGLGDSDGNLPTRLIDWQSHVNTGAYAPVLGEITKHLVERFRLRGVVVVGHCAGAVSALHGAAADERIRGLILMDPYFFLQREATRRHVLSRWHIWMMNRLDDDLERSVPSGQDTTEMGLLLRLRGIQSRLKHAMGMALLHILRGIQSRLKHVLLRVRGQRPPKSANVALIRCWKQVASSGRPMLVMSSPWSKPQVGSFDYLGYLRAVSDRRSRIGCQVIDGTNHNFTDGPGRAAVRQFIQQWLAGNFPLAGYEDSSARERSSKDVLGVSRGADAALLAGV